MVEKSPKLLWGVIAFTIYFTLVGLLIFYFNTRNEDKSKHYVKKDEKRIQVALSTPKKHKIIKPKPKLKSKKIVKPTVKPKINKKKKLKYNKDSKKKRIKEKIVKKIPKKKKDQNITKHKFKKTKVKKKKKQTKLKKKKTLDLFSNVKTQKKKLEIKVSDTPVTQKVKNNIIKVVDAPPSALERINQSMKHQKSMDSGVENAYFAKVQRMLQAWPARSEFLGEEATVTLYIKPTGSFEYQVTSGSNNEAFGKSVVDFLNQLQRIGFGRHNAGRTYEFEVEFSAKE